MGKTNVTVDVASGADQTVMATVADGVVVAVDAPQPMPEPEGGWPADEFTGKGGSYVRDPFTGVRTPAAVAE